jgi:hypothetical protein
MLSLIACPDTECGAPAEVIDSGTVHSTAGPVLMITTMCIHRHWLLLPADRVGRVAPVLITAVRAAGE